VIAVNLSTGSTVHTYATQFYPYGGMFVLPDESQLYVGTCALATYGGSSVDACGSGYVEVFDIASEQELAVISLNGDIASSLIGTSNAVYVVHNAPPPIIIPPDVSAQNASIPENSVTAVSTATFQAVGSYQPASSALGSMVIAGNTGYLVDGGLLLVIDLQQMTLQGTVPLPSGFKPQSIAVSASGATLAIAGSSSAGNQLLLFNNAIQAITLTASASAANSLSMSPNGGTIYFLDGGGIESLNATTGTITTEVSAAGEPLPIASFILLPGGQALYQILSGGSIVRLHEPFKVTGLLSVTQQYYSLAVSPDNNTLYLGSQSGGITAISSATGAVLSSMIPDIGISAVAVSSDGGTLYAISTNAFLTQFLFINASTGALEKTLYIAGCYFHTAQTALSPNGTYAYASLAPGIGSTSSCGATTPINLKTRTEDAPILGPGGAAVSPSGRYLYASALDAVDVIDLTTRKQVGTIPVTAGAIVFSPGGAKAYITSFYCNSSQAPCSGGVSVVDTSTLQILSFVPGGAAISAQGMALTEDGLFLYVADGPAIYTPTMTVLGQVNIGPPIVIH